MVNLRLDGHVHSCYSGDSYLKRMTPGKIIRRALDVGLGFLIVTDSNQDVFFDDVRCKALSMWRYGVAPEDGFGRDVGIVSLKRGGQRLYVARGIEHHDDEEGHLLVWGQREKITHKPNYTNKDRIQQAHDLGGIAGPAHTFSRSIGGISRERLDQIASYIDFMEVFNANNWRGEGDEQVAMNYACGLGVPCVAGSDAHRVIDVGRAYTDVGCVEFANPEVILDALKYQIKKGNTIVGGKHISLPGVLDWMVIERIKTGDWSGLVGLSKPIFRILGRKQ